MIGRVFRWIFSRGAEAVLALVLVLACFLSFLGLLTLTFPEGTRLTDLVRSNGSRTLAEGDRRSLELDMGDFGNRAVVATLSSLDRKVRHKPRGEIDWRSTEEGMPLHHRHAVQTFDDSEATISFDEGHVLRLDENSLVVVKNTGSLTKTRKRRRSLVVLDGTLHGRITAGDAEDLSLEIVAKNGESKIRPRASGSKAAVFTAVVGEDDETVLSIHEGEAEISTGEQTVVVKANEAVVMTKDHAVSAPVTLPGPPKLQAPANRFSEVFRSRPPPVRFAWTRSPDAERYRITIARDAKFRKIIYEDDLTASEVTHSNLKAGTYYWRVRGVREGAVGAASEVRRLTLTTDRKPPKLDVAFPQGVVSAPQVVMKGVTDPGVRVFIADRPVAVDARGRFEHALELERGANMVVVEAVDESGNTTYRSELIHARY